jgi:selT/selW/selH-like putative selenoprotein
MIITPSHGGRFEIVVDGSLRFSKLKEGRFPEDDEVDALL